MKVSEEKGGESTLPNEKQLQFAIEDYQARFSALSDFAERAWTRFNWFLTLNLGLLGLLILKQDDISGYDDLKTWLLLAGIVLSVLWAVLGREDEASMKRYGEEWKAVRDFVSRALQIDHIAPWSGKKSRKGFRQGLLLFIVPIFFIIGWVILLGLSLAGITL